MQLPGRSPLRMLREVNEFGLGNIFQTLRHISP
jgi:hypothetical protein